MFVKKSTFEAMRRERDDALALAEKRKAYTVSIIDENADRMERRNNELYEQDVLIANLRAELATTYVRDAKGRIARHPSAPKVAK